jgi:glycosyltransferase involved in cell wall biosynthesis
VTEIFPPHIGGPATFIPRVAEALARRHGYEVTVVCTSEAPDDPGDAARPYRVRRLWTGNRLRFQLEARRLLALEVARHRRVLVNGLERLVGPIAQVLRRGFVLKVVGDPAWEMARNQGRTLLDIDRFQVDAGGDRALAPVIAARDRAVRLARHVITPSDHLRRLVEGWGVPPGRVSTVPNGVDLEERDDRLPAGRSGGPLRALFVGRLTNWKGVETLLLAVARMPEVAATVVGDGPEHPHLVELGRQLGVAGRVRFTGRLAPDAVAREMRSAHVLVLTSLYEGLSHTLLEALAAGLPCVASRCGGNGEVIRDGVEGMLIDPQDVGALTGALGRLDRDEGLRLGMARAARERAWDFPLARTVEQFADILRAA